MSVMHFNLRVLHYNIIYNPCFKNTIMCCDCNNSGKKLPKQLFINLQRIEKFALWINDYYMTKTLVYHKNGKYTVC